MSGRTTHVAVVAAWAALLVVCVAGCQLVSAPQRHGRSVTEPVRPPALLLLVLANITPQTWAAFGTAVTGTAQFGEHLIVVGPAGRMLGSFAAPGPPVITGPAFPAQLHADATNFQQDAYRKSEAKAAAELRRDRQSLARRSHELLQSWAVGAVATVRAALAQAQASRPSLTRAIVAAAVAATSLRQEGLGFGNRQMLGIIGVGGGSPVRVFASLTGMTVAVTGTEDGGSDAAWQSSLITAGASRAYVLPSVQSGMLGGLISGCLSGRDKVPFILTGFRYGPAQYRLPRAATPSLDRLLHLLTVTYPKATANIDGYTDDVPVRGGNLALSWRRAEAVLAWLVAHGVAAARLEAIGHGAADPVTRGTAGPQPPDRRVLVIVSPG